ncbi:hypothetical protein GCM10027341_48410 [Spirosoma knui]
MALNQQAANLVDTTVNAFNGDVTSISPMDGISLIDSWINTLRNNDQDNNPITTGLSDLKAELQSGNPDGDQIQSILEDLTDQVRQLANSADTDVKTKLTPLTEALQGFSEQMSGSSGRANTGGQAPMTSTVGGESTNSGVGSSGNDTGEIDYSTRNGGTVDSNGSAMGMDDQTGSEGGMSSPSDESSDSEQDTEDSSGDSDRPQDGGSYGSGYGTGSNGDDYSANSGTQRSGVSGGSTSSGSSDTDTGTSGGRSQY